MTSPIAEFGRAARLSHFKGGYSGGHSHTREVLIPASMVNVQCSVSTGQATTLGPFGASAGVVTFTRPNGQVINFGNNAEEWPPLVFDDATRVVLGLWVIRGVMQGSMVVTLWR